MNQAKLPLSGIRVIEFSHMVMGPTCGMVLADLGAEVVKIEPIAGDSTRHLLGAGAGFFAMFNRNKQSIALNLHSAQGLEVAHKLIASPKNNPVHMRSGLRRAPHLSRRFAICVASCVLRWQALRAWLSEKAAVYGQCSQPATCRAA